MIRFIYRLMVLITLGILLYCANGITHHFLFGRGNIRIFESGWTYVDGETADLNALKVNKDSLRRPIILTKEFTERNGKDASLCMRSKNIHFRVFVSNREIYSFFPKNPAILGKSYGNSFHNIALPGIRVKDKIIIAAYPIYSDSSCFFDEVYVGNAGQYVQYIIRTRLAGFLTCLIMLITGMIMIVIALMSKSEKKEKEKLAYLGVSVILCALWATSETLIIQLLTGRSELVNVMSYFLLMLIPFATYYFIVCVFETYTEFGLIVIGVLTILNFFTNVFLCIGGIQDYHETLPGTNAIIVLTFILILRLVSSKIRKKEIQANEMKKILWGLFFITIGQIIDFVRYQMGHVSDLELFTRIGLLVFVLYLGNYVIGDILRMIRLSNEAGVMRKLAYTDALTGLANRTAYKRMCEEWNANPSEIPIAVAVFDINNLKQVNDQCGHAAGDRHIIMAATILEKAMGSRGTCYRTGGDEFIGVFCGDNLSDVWEKCLHEIYQLEEEYNKSDSIPCVMEIACGVAFGDEGETGIALDELEKKADQLMYEHKESMKKK